MANKRQDPNQITAERLSVTAPVHDTYVSPTPVADDVSGMAAFTQSMRGFSKSLDANMAKKGESVFDRFNKNRRGKLAEPQPPRDDSRDVLFGEGGA